MVYQSGFDITPMPPCHRRSLEAKPSGLSFEDEDGGKDLVTRWQWSWPSDPFFGLDFSVEIIHSAWWFIPLSKWVITLVINGISGGNVH